MRIGLWGARADNSGLGTQTWEFYRHIKPDKTMVIDIADHNPDRKQYFERFPDAQIVSGTPDPMAMTKFLKDLDIVFCVETPYNYEFFDYARAMGVKTVLQYNFEFLEYLQDTNLPAPDLFAAPSMWFYKEMPFANKAFLPVPVDRDRLPYQNRKKIKTIIHLAGQKLIADRNGTDIFLEALPFLDPKLKVIIYTQHELFEPGTTISVANPKNLTVKSIDKENYWELYNEGDMLVLPRKFGGLCLPLNEASSRGMIVLMPDISPQNAILPSMALVKVFSHKDVETKLTLRAYETDPKLLAARINHIARCDEEVVGGLSNVSNVYANGISWTFLKPLYLKVFETLVGGENDRNSERADKS